MSIDKKIFSEKLYFRENAHSKVNSLDNIDHQARFSDKQIYQEYLPWLHYNKPNLPDLVRDQINRKQYFLEQYNNNSLENNWENKNKSKNISFPKLSDEKEDKKLVKVLNNKNEDKNKNKTVEKENKEISVKINKKNKKGHYSPSASRSKDSSENSFLIKQPSNKNYQNPPNKKSNQNLNVKKDSVNSDSHHVEVEKHEVSTETESINLVSVEVQTIKEISKQKVSKLDKALKNSNTLENSYSLIPRRYKNLQVIKSNKNGLEPKEEIITTRIIESFLPFIKTNVPEKKTKQNKSYSYINTEKNNILKTGESSEVKQPVIHAGMDFLDQYWASQRWLKLNKQTNEPQRASSDSFISDNHQESKTDMPFVLRMNSLKKLDHKEKHNFRDLFNERIKYYTDLGEHNVYKANPQVEKINVKDLEYIVQ